MIDSFFVPSFGNRPKHLVGRETVLKQFEMVFNSVPGSRERSLLILGQRGSGKTVLLLEMAEMAKRNGFFVADPTIVSSGMCNRIIEKLTDAHPEYSPGGHKKIAGGNVSVMGFGAGIQFNDESSKDKSFSWKIAQFCSKANEDHHGVMILIDEVQSNSEELRQLIIAYQEMIGKGMNIALVLAGLPMSVSSLLNDHVLTFLNRAVKIILPLLRIEDIELYYKNAFESLGIKLSNQMINKAALKSCGSPYMMQLIGHYITLSYNNSISETEFEESLRYAEEAFKNDICRTTLSTLSNQDVNFLLAMTMDSEESSVVDISTRLKKNPSFVQTYKRRLIQSGIIEVPRRGMVAFAIPYLKDYLSSIENS